jgi:cysteine-rich repeat protein
MEASLIIEKKTIKAVVYLGVLALFFAPTSGCGSSADVEFPLTGSTIFGGQGGVVGPGGSAGAGSGNGQNGQVGEGGMAGQGGENTAGFSGSGMSGTGGNGQAGKGGMAGQGGQGGQNGQAGASGMSGTSGGQSGAGQAGSAGSSGNAGGTGTAGMAGTSGTSGTAGSSGLAGQAGTGQAGSTTGMIATNECPAQAPAINFGKHVLSGSTSSSDNNSSGNCGGTQGKDKVIAFQTLYKGFLRIDGTFNYAGMLYLRSNCASGDNVSCEFLSGFPPGNVSLPLQPVPAGSTWYLWVDGRGIIDTNGNYSITIEYLPDGCGNTILEAGEECEDGNLDAGDGCSSQCKFEPECTFSEPVDATFSSPWVAPPACKTILIHPSSLEKDNDSDWMELFLKDGQHVDARVFQEKIGSCNQGLGKPVVSLELYQDLATEPSHGNCQVFGGEAVACQDGGFDPAPGCQTLEYEVPSGKGGTYKLRMFERGQNATVPDYGVFLRLSP